MTPSSIENKKFVSCKAEKRSMALQKAIVSANAVVVFSKSYCPYRVTLKQLLQQHGATFKAIELDNESDGIEIQAALVEWTSQRTVPNVFSGVTLQLLKEGRLVPLLIEDGAIAKLST